MIWESYYYKDELAEIAHRLAKRKNFKKWNEKSLVLLEKDVFIAFFYIRKLLEAKKLSYLIGKQKIKLKAFLGKEKNATLLNNHKLDDLFNLNKENQEHVKLEFLCNQIIHSYILQICFEEFHDGLIGLFFCSDKKRNKKLYYIEIDNLIELLISISQDYPTNSIKKFNPETKDYEVLNYMPEHIKGKNFGHKNNGRVS